MDRCVDRGMDRVRFPERLAIRWNKFFWEVVVRANIPARFFVRVAFVRCDFASWTSFVTFFWILFSSNILYRRIRDDSVDFDDRSWETFRIYYRLVFKFFFLCYLNFIEIIFFEFKIWLLNRKRLFILFLLIKLTFTMIMFHDWLISNIMDYTLKISNYNSLSLS